MSIIYFGIAKLYLLPIYQITVYNFTIMKSIFSVIIFVIFISCTKSDQYEGHYFPSQKRSENLNLSKLEDDTQMKYSTIRYKTNFICNPPKEIISSRKDIQAYINDSKLVLRSKYRFLIKATHLFYGDDFDLEAYITYPNYTTSQIRGYSFLIIPLTPTIGCIDRAEVTLLLGDHPIVKVN